MAMVGNAEREKFLEEGYLVVPDVVPTSLCEQVVDAILEFTGVDMEDPATWHQERFAGLGIVPIHQHQALWNVRQHPDVYAVFRTLYQRDDLWVTMDRAGYKPPAGEATRDWQRAAVHWDCDAWTFDGVGIQGLVYLTDTRADQGAFSCVPSIYRNLPAWRQAHANDADRRHPEVAEEDIVAVPGSAGSLVVFHRLMPHTNGLNRADRPRFAQYVTMNPVGEESERAARVELWKTKQPPEWAARQKVLGQQIPEPGAPAHLTELGRKLVGVDAW
ncbi:MAG TPA: phytanoyl-CoA dioxygenase family protein [Pseudomonadales bacterium]|nr:phytanoyl-CoA dioxygenase family protein [Pseudomonadales bacterium]